MARSDDRSDSYSTDSDEQSWWYYFLRCKGSSRMTAIETLELSPWAKFAKFGLFPWKMFFHICLIALSTTQTILSNLHYGEYSLAMGRNFVNLFFPTNYADYQTEFLSTSQYYIFTMNDTIYDAQRLVNIYYNLPSISVNQMVIADPNAWTGISTNKIETPRLHVKSMKKMYSKQYDLYNSTSGWPFAKSSPIVTNSNDTRTYFDDLDSMLFQFQVKSFGFGSGSESQDDTCIFWDVWFLYDLTERGQVLVTNSYYPRRRCDDYSLVSRTFVISAFLFVFSVVYMLLLIKAVFNHFHIFYIIGKSARIVQLNALRNEKREKREMEQKEIVQDNDFGVQGTDGKQGSVEMKRSFEYGPGKHFEADALVDAINSAKPTSSSKKPKPYGLASDYAISVDHSRNQHGFDRWTHGGSHNDELRPHEKSLLSDTDRIQSNQSASTPTQDSFDAEFVSKDMTVLRASRFHDDGDLANRATWDMVRDRVSSISTIDFQDVEDAWVTLSWREKLYIFNLWFVAGFAANFLAVAYSIFVLKSRNANTASITIKSLLGIASLLYWVAVAQYFEFNPRLYVLILTLKKGMPRVLQFLAGILPFFIGYALLGLSLFGDETDYFGSLRATFITLFACVNGDNIHNTFSALNVIPYVGDLYLAVFIIIFMYVVLMTIIAIVEEAFFSSHDSSKTDSIGKAFDSDDMQRFDDKSGLDTGNEGNDDSKGAAISSDHLKNRRLMMKNLLKHPIVGENTEPIDDNSKYVPPALDTTASAKPESSDINENLHPSHVGAVRTVSLSAAVRHKSSDGDLALKTTANQPQPAARASTRQLPPMLKELARQASLVQNQHHHHHHHHKKKKMDTGSDSDAHNDSSNSSGGEEVHTTQKLGDIESHKPHDDGSSQMHESEDFNRMVSERIHALKDRTDLSPFEIAELAIKDAIAELNNEIQA